MKVKEFLALTIDDTDIEIYIDNELVGEIYGLYNEFPNEENKRIIKEYGDREIKEIFAPEYNTICITI